MEFQAELAHTLDRVPSDLNQLSALIDPAWIEQTLQATGKASIRRRKLPAEQVMWLVIGLALSRNLPIWHVVHQLNLTLGGEPLTAPSTAIQARQRLGDEPLAHLFRQLAQHWAAPHAATRAELHGLALLAVDGVVWSAPDTPANRLELGGCANQYGEGGWPQIRAVCLMDIRRHATQTLGFIIRAGPPVRPASSTRRSHLSQSRQTPSEQVSSEKMLVSGLTDWH
jgi:hypothetical protein